MLAEQTPRASELVTGGLPTGFLSQGQPPAARVRGARPLLLQGAFPGLLLPLG